jgi:prepilin-type N-terminal cleavage/methylation domain-containing protein
MKLKAKQSGFTLVEILIVLGIIAAVAAIFIPVALNLVERNQVNKAASMLENAFQLAKARAIAEKRPNGVRLIATSNGLRTMSSGAAFAWYDELQYIEVPEDYSEHWVWGLTNSTNLATQPFWSTVAPPVGPASPSPGALPLGLDVVSVAAGPYTFSAQSITSFGANVSVTANRDNCLFGPISTIVGANNWTAVSGTQYRSQRFAFNPLAQNPYSIQPGDQIEVNGVGELFTVQAVSTTNVDISVAPSARVIVPIYVVDRAIPRNIEVPLNGRTNYRVIRQPRIIPALSPVKLPQDTVIDLTLSRAAFLGIPTGDLSTTNNFFMSGVSTGLGVSGITGITTATPNLAAPLYVDIMFSASGEMIPTAQVFRNGTVVGSFSVGASGLVALWLHQRGDPNLWAARQATAAQGQADNQAIVAVNARTGFIGSYPVAPLAISTDPLNYARTGKGRTSADTGQ